MRFISIIAAVALLAYAVIVLWQTIDLRVLPCTGIIQHTACVLLR